MEQCQPYRDALSLSSGCTNALGNKGANLTRKVYFINVYITGKAENLLKRS